ncbi:META domain-containing protein [Dinoroseobacter sp. S124A]|uniref:META domain-containing protein n=1 Tax=Dinoroseobacter sp. S124A TaxID=3415128 RepID=UPI003C7E5F3D
MTKLPLAAAALIPFLAACTASDETLSGFTSPETVWTLSELDGTPFAARMTLQFLEPGQIAGQAPCNRFTGALTVPYPWFGTGPLAATRMACPDLAAEDMVFKALSDMTEAEVSGPVLILRNSELGREMVFRAAP